MGMKPAINNASNLFYNSKIEAVIADSGYSHEREDSYVFYSVLNTELKY
jgi:hypothetical protein